MRIRLLAAVLLAVAAAAAAGPPDVQTIVDRMRAAMEPPRASTRRFTLTVSGEGAETRFTVAQARKIVEGRLRLLTVVLGPPEQRGVASLITQGGGGQPDVRALWVPAVRRTRLLTPVGGFEAYLNSDFTYADLGFVDTQARYSLLGASTHDGRPGWQVQAVPREDWYYSKIVWTVDAGTLLPLERSYYDPAGVLWKVERFEDVTVIDGQPVATHVTMEDRHTKQSSELVVEALEFGVDLPDALFQPRNLRSAIDSPLWPGT